METPTQIAAIFPTPLGMFRFENFTEAEFDHIAALDTINNMGNLRSKRSDLHQDPLLTRIFSFAQTCCESFVETILEPQTVPEIYITTAWANYTEKGGYHHKHQHANSFLSGVLYVQVADGDKVEFYHPYDPHQRLYLPAANYNIFNSLSWEIPAHNGLLLIFPSYLHHSVPVKLTDGTRIALSFNTYLRGNIGNEILSNHLQLK